MNDEKEFFGYVVRWLLSRESPKDTTKRLISWLHRAFPNTEKELQHKEFRRKHNAIYWQRHKHQLSEKRKLLRKQKEGTHG